MFNPLNLLTKLIKSSNQRDIDKIQKIVAKVNDQEKLVSEYSDKDFPKKTEELIHKVKEGSSLNDILVEAFALVREASKRVTGERHFDVQILGGVALHQSNIAEMKTGEGKTLTISLAAYLNALEKKGVHVVTVNDYLAKRDCENMGKIYNFLGLTAGYINNDQSDEERKKNYNCDITYATNSELGFDYLRDNMKFSQETIVQRGHNFAIVDEIDSCLIDEARTPLIISGAVEDRTVQYLAVDKLLKNFNEENYEIDEKDKNVLLTNKGIDAIENIFTNAKIMKNKSFYDPENIGLVHLVNQALRANLLYQNGRDYIVKNNEVIIIDEQTGRQLPGRRFGDGLHQSIEAKEKVEIQSENQTLASITYQNYFKMYSKLSGCTGTAATESQEFYEIYNLKVISIPTNKKMIRKDWNDQIFRTSIEKDNAILKKIIESHTNGQPILIFTASVNKSEHYSKLLKEKNITHTILNAKNHEKEAEIIANAGKKGSVIVTTSISGRGVDIKLGGREANKENKNEIKSLGGLFVIGTERMESRRVDNQARGRSGRQGDEGNSIFYVSLEDDLMRIFGSESMNNILEKLGLKDGESIDHPWINKALERAQQKVEARNFDVRKSLLKFDNVLNDQRHVIFSQRNNVILNKETFDYSNDFLDEKINQLIELKSIHLSKPKNSTFVMETKKLLGKTSDIFNSEIQKDENDLANISNNEFSEKIKKRFEEKRSGREKFLGKEQAQELEKRIFLQIIDENWKSHIQYLEQLRSVIGLRSYGQRDPLVEYKKEAFSLFENLLNKIKSELITILLNITLVDDRSNNLENENKKNENFKEVASKKIGRNEKCLCGSGKKYKHCCGRL
tara:strand:- start:5827 stop:8376 length:2550 start_codon:yes stop_codon:yes gene_type:complete